MMAESRQTLIREDVQEMEVLDSEIFLLRFLHSTPRGPMLQFSAALKSSISIKNTMPQALEHSNGNGVIKVGTTGTISSLMSRELEAMKLTQQSSELFQKPGTQISVPFGCTAKRSQQRKNTYSESSCSNSRNHSTDSKSPRAAQSPRNNKINGQQIPMLVSADTTVDQNMKSNKSGKKGHAYIVEVVDVKCGNPMSNKLKKIGFSKLSDSNS